MYASHEQPVQRPWLSIVGLGEPGWDGLAPDARAAVEQAELVVGGERHLAMLPAVSGQQRMAWPSPLLDAVATLRDWQGRPVCVLASGDPFWFGVGATLARYFAAADMRVWPQPSAFSLAAARLGWALQHVGCLSACGRDLDHVSRHLADGARLLVLARDGATPAALAKLLCAHGFGASQMTVLERLGGPHERRLGAAADEWTQAQTHALNVIAVDCVAVDCVAATPAVGTVPGRPSACFSQDGQITRAEVRAAVLAALAPGRGECLWDIGAGSGAISIEWLLADAGNQAIAIESRADRVEHIHCNAQRFGVPALTCVPGRAPAALADLAPPQAIFIGGGLTAPGLLPACIDALQVQQRGRLVATSVTLQGDAVLAEAVQQYGGSLRRIQVSRAEPLGRFLGWSSDRPITIWQFNCEEQSA